MNQRLPRWSVITATAVLVVVTPGAAVSAVYLSRLDSPFSEATSAPEPQTPVGILDGAADQPGRSFSAADRDEEEFTEEEFTEEEFPEEEFTDEEFTDEEFTDEELTEEEFTEEEFTDEELTEDEFPEEETGEETGEEEEEDGTEEETDEETDEDETDEDDTGDSGGAVIAKPVRVSKPAKPGGGTAPAPVAPPAPPLPPLPPIPGIPPVVYDIYRAVTDFINRIHHGCQLQLNTVAALGAVASNHAAEGAIDAAGTTTAALRGQALDGRDGRANVTSISGLPVAAAGPMMLLPEIWHTFKADGNNDGVADPNNTHDAVRTAAECLCDDNANMADPAQVEDALKKWHLSKEQHTQVLDLSRQYAAAAAPPAQTPPAGGSPVATVPDQSPGTAPAPSDPAPSDPAPSDPAPSDPAPKIATPASPSTSSATPRRVGTTG